MTSSVKALAAKAPLVDVDPSVKEFPSKMRAGAPSAMRLAQRFGGVAMSVASLTLMFVPFGATTSTEYLCKMMVALVFGFVGIAMWDAGSRRSTPELEIDMIRRELRLVRWVGNTRTESARSTFADLSRAEIVGKTARLWDKAGELVADVALPDETSVRSLKRSLQDEGVPV